MNIRDANQNYVYLEQKIRGIKYYERLLEKLSHKIEDKDCLEKISGVGLQVLIVDDNLANLKLLSSYFRHLDMRCVSARGGKEAIQILKNEKIKLDLAVIDQMMPGMDGMQTVKEIRQMEDQGADKLPIIMLSAFVMKNEEKFMGEHQLQGILIKPVEVARLEKMILKCMKGYVKKNGEG